jgi:hypothetical protein
MKSPFISKANFRSDDMPVKCAGLEFVLCSPGFAGGVASVASVDPALNAHAITSSSVSLSIFRVGAGRRDSFFNRLTSFLGW